MEKLVVCIMGQNCEKFIGMALESVKDADAIVYCDGGSIDKTQNICSHYGTDFIINEYNQEDKGMNGKQRNFYLKYLKENYKDYWALCIDADEIVDDLSKIKAFIQEAQDNIYGIKMRHFIGDLGHEDATKKVHVALGRLFKLDNKLSYPESEHPVIQGKEHLAIQPTTIWHLAYCNSIWDTRSKYLNHIKKSQIHTPQFLKKWYYSHLFGQYPRTEINLTDIPDIIYKEFGIDKDEFYFTTRMQIQTSHFIMMRQWLDWAQPKSVLDLGCGMGHYGFAGKFINKDLEYKGLELSKWAIDNSIYGLDIKQGDITKSIPKGEYNLTLAIDILEHLEEVDLDKVLKKIAKVSDKVIFSIPFLGDPNLELDKTHKIKKPKEWWLEQLGKHFKIGETPKGWAFASQLIVGERK